MLIKKISIEKFTESLKTDKRLFNADVWNSKAHTLMLAKCGIIGKSDAEIILKCLKKAENEFRNKKFKFHEELEDVHMNIESYVLKEGGEKCGVMHTARSRNDQVVTDTRILTRESANKTTENLLNLCKVILKLAEENDIVVPGYTHTQQAMPTLFSHWLTAYFDAFARDIERIEDAYKRINLSPLGSAAFAGTSFPIDRDYTAKLLGFDGIIENSLDAVASRDFIAEILSDLAILMSNLSRLSEEIVLYSTSEFRLIKISEKYTTGSSIMPQKRNPDIAELVRGKTGRIYGNLINILTTLKALPYSYNRDMQEDKIPLFDSFDEVNACIEITAEMLQNIKLEKREMDKEIIATDLANLLTTKKTPFRKAYSIVKESIYGNLDLTQYLKKEEIAMLTPEKCIMLRKSKGSASPKEVERMIKERKIKIKEFNKRMTERIKKIDEGMKMTEEEIKIILK